MSHFHVRKATAEDMEQVHALIHELAVYEKAEDEVLTTPAQLRADGFGDNALFEAFVAENEEGRVVGIAFFYTGYSTWKGKKLYLDDLVVTQAYRRKGVGQRLFERVVAHAHEVGAQQLRWHVLDWNTPAINFYKKIEARLEDDWITCKLERDQLAS